MSLGDTATADQGRTLAGRRHILHGRHKEVVQREHTVENEPQAAAEADTSPIEDAYREAFDHLIKRWEQKGMC